MLRILKKNVSQNMFYNIFLKKHAFKLFDYKIKYITFAALIK